MFSLAVHADNPAVSDMTSWNTSRLLAASQEALLMPPADVATAASYSALAELRLAADRYCFPPVDEKEVERLERTQAWIAPRLKPVMAQQAVMSHMVADVSAWDPSITPSYSPGWTYKSRCSDYPSVIGDMRQEFLQQPERLLVLYKQPGYEQAYGVFTDVEQDYDRAPPDDAYSPARLKQLADAVQTMRSVEQQQNKPFVGTMAALSHPIAFHVLGTSRPDHSITYGGEKDDPPDSHEVHLIHDQAAFQRLWDVLDAGFVPMPLPDVDFSKQMVVFVQQAQRDASADRSFINRIEFSDGPNPLLVVYVRTPVWLDMCHPDSSQSYPYMIAVIDKPGHLPVTTGIDEQNFPMEGCPDGEAPWPPPWIPMGATPVEPAHTVSLGGEKILSYSGEHVSQNALLDTWGKLGYKSPQKLGDKEFVTEIIEVHLDCAKMAYAQLRDMKLDAAGAVVSDDSTVTPFAALPVDFTDNLGELPPAESIAMDAVDFDCTFDSE